MINTLEYLDIWLSLNKFTIKLSKTNYLLILKQNYLLY